MAARQRASVEEAALRAVFPQLVEEVRATDVIDQLYQRNLLEKNEYEGIADASHMIQGKDDAELGLHGNVVGALRLYTYSEVPTFLKGNPFITHGYRLYLPTGLCFKR